MAKWYGVHTVVNALKISWVKATALLDSTQINSSVFCCIFFTLLVILFTIWQKKKNTAMWACVEHITKNNPSQSLQTSVVPSGSSHPKNSNRKKGHRLLNFNKYLNKKIVVLYSFSGMMSPYFMWHNINESVFPLQKACIICFEINLPVSTYALPKIYEKKSVQLHKYYTNTCMKLTCTHTHICPLSL